MEINIYEINEMNKQIKNLEKQLDDKDTNEILSYEEEEVRKAGDELKQLKVKEVQNDGNLTAQEWLKVDVLEKKIKEKTEKISNLKENKKEIKSKILEIRLQQKKIDKELDFEKAKLELEKEELQEKWSEALSIINKNTEKMKDLEKDSEDYKLLKEDNDKQKSIMIDNVITSKKGVELSNKIEDIIAMKSLIKSGEVLEGIESSKEKVNKEQPESINKKEQLVEKDNKVQSGLKEDSVAQIRTSKNYKLRLSKQQNTTKNTPIEESKTKQQIYNEYKDKKYSEKGDLAGPRTTTQSYKESVRSQEYFINELYKKQAATKENSASKKRTNKVYKVSLSKQQDTPKEEPKTKQQKYNEYMDKKYSEKGDLAGPRHTSQAYKESVRNQNEIIKEIENRPTFIFDSETGKIKFKTEDVEKTFDISLYMRGKVKKEAIENILTGILWDSEEDKKDYMIKTNMMKDILNPAILKILYDEDRIDLLLEYIDAVYNKSKKELPFKYEINNLKNTSFFRKNGLAFRRLNNQAQIDNNNLGMNFETKDTVLGKFKSLWKNLTNNIKAIGDGLAHSNAEIEEELIEFEDEIEGQETNDFAKQQKYIAYYQNDFREKPICITSMDEMENGVNYAIYEGISPYNRPTLSINLENKDRFRKIEDQSINSTFFTYIASENPRIEYVEELDMYDGKNYYSILDRKNGNQYLIDTEKYYTSGVIQFRTVCVKNNRLNDKIRYDYSEEFDKYVTSNKDILFDFQTGEMLEEGKDYAKELATEEVMNMFGEGFHKEDTTINNNIVSLITGKMMSFAKKVVEKHKLNIKQETKEQLQEENLIDTQQPEEQDY